MAKETIRRVLTYVDDPLSRQIATGLIGSEVQISEKEGSSYGINFKVLIRQDQGVERSTRTRLADLLPEVVAEAINDAVKDRITDLATSRERFVAGASGGYVPGTPVVISNAQFVTDGKTATATLGGEDCVCYRLRLGEFYLHAYCLPKAEPLLDSLVGQPVEVAGLLRYTPAYTVPGALSLNLGLRVCAVWLR